MNYEVKYLKYKTKYLNLKRNNNKHKQFGGVYGVPDELKADWQLANLGGHQNCGIFISNKPENAKKIIKCTGMGSEKNDKGLFPSNEINKIMHIFPQVYSENQYTDPNNSSTKNTVPSRR